MRRLFPPAVRVTLLVLLASVLSASSCSWSFHSDHDDDDDDDDTITIVTQEAEFGGWQLAADLAGQDGVISTQRGWDGAGFFFGELFARWTGHRRVTRVVFDPARLGFPELLAVVRSARAEASRVTVYACSAEQEHAARQNWPAGLPILLLRQATTFRSH